MTRKINANIDTALQLASTTAEEASWVVLTSAHALGVVQPNGPQSESADSYDDALNRAKQIAGGRDRNVCAVLVGPEGVSYAPPSHPDDPEGDPRESFVEVAIVRANGRIAHVHA